MVFLIVAVMFAGLMFFTWYLDKRKKSVTADAPASETTNQAELFLHPSHTFARVLDDSTVEIGMDDFAKRAFGKIDEIDLPEAGAVLNQGDQAWKITIGEHHVSQRMPVEGTVLKSNDESSDWLLKVKPSNLEKNLGNLINSSSVVTWLKDARTKFVANYYGDMAPVMQDGGELAEGFARHLTDEQWKQFCKEFFNCQN